MKMLDKPFKTVIFVLRLIDPTGRKLFQGIDAAKIKISGDPKYFDAVCDEFDMVINKSGLTKEVIATPITIEDATGVIVAVDDNRFCSGGEWTVR